MRRAALALALGPALGLACKDAPEAPAPTSIPATATSTTTLAPWPGHLANLRGARLDAEGGVALADLATEDGPTVFAFWATYCPPCLAEMPMFEAAHARGVRVVGVSLDAGATDEVRRVLAEREVTYPNVVLDAPSMKAAGRALPGGLPATVVLDGRRAPRVALLGKVTPPELEAALRIASP